MCALEHASEHPIAKAIVAGASAEPPAVEDFQNLEGLGVQSVIDGHAVLVGRERLLAEWSVHLDEKLATAKKEAEQKGRTAVLVAWDGKARGVLVVADTVKPTPEEAIEGRPGATPAASGDQCGHSTGQQAGPEALRVTLDPAFARQSPDGPQPCELGTDSGGDATQPGAYSVNIV